MPMKGRFPERQHVAGAALSAVYITNRPEGNLNPIVRACACVSSPGLSLGVAAEPSAVNVDFVKGARWLDLPLIRTEQATHCNATLHLALVTAAFLEHQA